MLTDHRDGVDLGKSLQLPEAAARAWVEAGRPQAGNWPQQGDRAGVFGAPPTLVLDDPPPTLHDAEREVQVRAGVAHLPHLAE
jgi:hypothetical protein